MKKGILWYVMIGIFLFPTIVIAADITLLWDKNPEAELTQYKLYYGLTTGGPYTGIGLSEGDSPIIIPISTLSDMNNPEITLTGADDTKSYFFVLTALDGNNIDSESLYSNEVKLNRKKLSPPKLREVFWRVLQAIWDKITGKDLRARWS